MQPVYSPISLILLLLLTITSSLSIPTSKLFLPRQEDTDTVSSGDYEFNTDPMMTAPPVDGSFGGPGAVCGVSVPS